MSNSPTITLTWPQEGIALLTFDMPDKSANILNTSVLKELEQHLDELENNDSCEGLILRSGKPGTFIAGADLREFVASLDAPAEEIEAMCRRGQTLFGRLSKTSFVTVAAIDGICVGGGAEMAVWCDRRILSKNDKTEIGFPEVKLGLFPGWGGTVRAPRIVGLSNAVEMITGGDSISAREAAAPMTRCLECNGRVRPVPTAEVLGKIPDGTRADFDEFFRCTRCEQVYWKGSHYERMQDFIATHLSAD